MQKWEYKIFELKGVQRDPAGLDNKAEDEIIDKWWDQLGEECWECYFLQFIHYSYSNDPEMTVKYAQNIKGYFKRPKED